MNSTLGRLALILGLIGLASSAGVAYAEGPHDGGRFGGGRFGGGQRFGGGHFAAPAHFGGGPGRAMVTTPRYAGGARFAPAPARAYADPRYAPGPHPMAGGRYAVGAQWDGGRRWGGERHFDDDDWGDHDRYWVGTYWGGGYWGGGYWPGVYYGVDFAWFLPVLPAVYATYWYDGIPYYYANDVYYTWDPSSDGYVATDPPPVADAAAPRAGDAAQIFMYPKHGQSPQQQADDRRACERWASDQVGGAGSATDYRRAMTACAEGRGYTAR